jgi:chromosome segregation ATPase|tara:strand:+ start:136 stop:429 length:294 start_codon:yes stop_codon:yes gene_type:complete
MDKEISAINDIRVFINNLKDELNLKNHENSKIKENILSKEQEISALNSNITVLNDQLKMLKLASQLDGNEVGSTTDIKLMINEMVREIDKCIALINK